MTIDSARRQSGAASTIAIVVLLVLAASGGLWWWMQRSPGETPAPARTETPTPPAPPAKNPEPVTAPAPQPVERPKPAVPTEGKLLYACGQEAPALNGVTESIRLDWIGPWSPIKTIVVDRGWEWYVHEDGSHSTTRMIEMNGVPQAMALRAQPTEPLPVFDANAMQRLRRQ